MAFLVLSVTVYTLITPAITAETDNTCPIAEHVHDESCYVTIEGEKEIICSAASLGAHVHSEECYNESGELICELPDYVLHSHDESCYNGAGELICPLPEISGEAHSHSEECYDENGVLICEKPELLQHIHDESCFIKGESVRELICGKVEHVHSEACQTLPEKSEDIEIVPEPAVTEAPAESPAPAETPVPDAIPSPEVPQEPDVIPSPEATQEPDVIPSPEATQEPIFPVAPEGDGAWAEPVPPEFAVMLFAAPSGSSDMRPMITELSVRYRTPGAQWQDLTDGITIHDGDEISCAISYTVPSHTLSAENNGIYYEAPKELKVLQTEDGIVRNTEGMEVGTYTISTDGLIDIRFNEEYTRLNAEGQPITGKIVFYASADRSKLGEDGILHLPFTDEKDLNIHVEENTEIIGDLHTKKSAQKLDGGKIKYTVTVSSSEGTTGNIDLQDMMTGIVYSGEISVKDSAGQDVALNPAPQPGANPIKIELPPLGPGELYTITYIAVSDYNNPQLSVNNVVKAFSTNNVNDRLESEASSAQSEFEMLSKSGVYNEAEKTLSWTVGINPDRLNISGWTLRDYITTNTEKEYVGEALLTYSDGSSKTIKLPYTFPEGSNDEYKVTYTTPAKYYRGGENYYTNRAVIGKDELIIDSAQDGIGIGGPELMGKHGGKARLEGNMAYIPWRVDIDLSSDGARDILEGLKSIQIYESLANYDESHYFTGAQLKGAKNAFLAASGLSASDIEILAIQIGPGGYLNWDRIVDEGHYRGFDIKCSTEKLLGKKFSFSFESTGIVADMTVPQKFKNTINLEGNFSSDEVIVEPEGLLLEKYDPAYPGAGNSNHSITEIKDGILTWKIKLHVPASKHGETVTLYETLPENTVLGDIYVNGNHLSEQKASWYWNEDRTVSTPNWTTPEGNKVYVTITKENDRLYKLEFPPELHAYSVEGSYDISVFAKLSADIPWHNNENGDSIADYKNSVNAQVGNETVSTSQTQTLVKSKLMGVITKGHAQEAHSNIVPYSVVINPNGLKLLENNETLTVTDILSYSTNGSFRANLVPGSVKVHLRNSDGTAGAEVEAPYIYDKSVDKASSTHSHSLSLSIPDGTPLILSYSYRFSGSIGVGGNVNNIVRLDGISDEFNNAGDQVYVEIQESGAVADIKGISFYKVDMNDNGKYLSGAEFRLCGWNSSTNNYEPVYDAAGSSIFKTDSNGRIAFTFETVPGLSYNKAYRLVETKAPEGYFVNKDSRDFYIFSEDKLLYPDSIPEGFAGQVLQDGDTMFYGDERATGHLKITKKWQDESGLPLVNTGVDTIGINILRQTAGGVPEKYMSCTLSAENNWSLTVNNLPIASVNSDGSRGGDYFYSVEEVKLPGYEVSYENNSGIISGEIIITNKLLPGYILPETGGAGLLPFIIGGAALMLGAVIILKKKNCRGSA